MSCVAQALLPVRVLRLPSDGQPALRLTKPHSQEWLCYLPRAHFVSGEVAQAVVGGILIQFGERWEIENQFDERIDRAAGFEHGHAEVDEFGRALAEDLDAQQWLLS